MIPLKDDIPTRRFPILTVLIIAACAFVYFIGEHGGIGLNDYGNKQVVKYGAIPYEISHPGKECGSAETAQGLAVQCPAAQHPDSTPWWVTAFTSMFMHGGILHLAGNMLFLWIFGNNVEDSMGRPRFVAFYLLGGLAALAGQIL